jgi:hypothetical protein
MLISPLFDENTDKIEPIAIGEKRFLTDDMSPLIEIVRQEGIEIAA